MATSTHPQESVYIGATWRFQVKLFNANGTPMDVSNKPLEWAMLDKGGAPVLFGPSDVTITRLSLGLIEIAVDKNKTITLPPGRYTDFLRVGGDDVILEGQLIARASPFKILVGGTGFIVLGPSLGAPVLSSP
jgi:hypothetical protein